jgi:hypothetical protein
MTFIHDVNRDAARTEPTFPPRLDPVERMLGLLAQFGEAGVAGVHAGRRRPAPPRDAAASSLMNDRSPDATRRRLLQSFSCAATALSPLALANRTSADAVARPAEEGVVDRRPVVAAPEPDLDDPAQHLRAYVRMRGATDDRVVVDVTQGLVYALLPSGRPRLLLQSRGLQIARYREAPDGAWVCRSSYFGSFADAATGALVEAWDNPFTGQRDEVPPTLYGPMDYVLTASRTLVNPTPAQRAQALAARAVRRWTRIGDLVTIVDELGPPDDPARPPDLDVVSLGARVADLADGSLASVPAQMAFGAVEPWRDWMRMGTRPGMLLWHLQGTKVDGIDAVPPDLLRAAEARRPGFVAQASA